MSGLFINAARETLRLTTHMSDTDMFVAFSNIFAFAYVRSHLQTMIPGTCTVKYDRPVNKTGRMWHGLPSLIPIPDKTILPKTRLHYGMRICAATMYNMSWPPMIGAALLREVVIKEGFHPDPAYGPQSLAPVQDTRVGGLVMSIRPRGQLRSADDVSNEADGSGLLNNAGLQQCVTEGKRSDCSNRSDACTLRKDTNGYWSELYAGSWGAHLAPEMVEHHSMEPLVNKLAARHGAWARDTGGIPGISNGDSITLYFKEDTNMISSHPVQELRLWGNIPDPSTAKEDIISTQGTFQLQFRDVSRA